MARGEENKVEKIKEVEGGKELGYLVCLVRLDQRPFVVSGKVATGGAGPRKEGTKASISYKYFV